jgi:hypothetical protein
MYVSPTYTMMMDVVLPELTEAIQRLSFQLGYQVARYSKSNRVWSFRNRYTLLMRSAERPDRLRGPNMSHIWVDESEVISAPMYTFNVLLGRMREASQPPYRIQQYKSMLVTTTPNGPTGMVGHIIQQQKEGDLDFMWVRQRSDENPALDDMFFRVMEGSYSEDFKREQLDAEIVVRSGSVYGKTFKQEPFNPGTGFASGNMIPWEYRPNLPTYVGIDWGHRRPHVLWYQYDQDGAYTGQEDTGVVFAEYKQDDVPLDNLIKYLQECIYDRRWWPDQFCIDPGGDTSLYGRKALRKAFPEIRIDYPGDRDERSIQWGTELVKARLCLASQKRRLLFRSNNPPEEIEGGFALDPVVQVDEDGKHRGIICCMAAGYVYRKKGLDIMPDKTGRIYDHGPDAMRYIATTIHRRELECLVDEYLPRQRRTRQGYRRNR